MYFLLNIGIFHCYVSLVEGKSFIAILRYTLYISIHNVVLKLEESIFLKVMGFTTTTKFTKYPNKQSTSMFTFLYLSFWSYLKTKMNVDQGQKSEAG